MGCNHWHANQDVGDAPVFAAELFLALGMTVWFLMRANRGLRSQLVEERARAPRFSPDLEQSNHEREQYRGYWNDTFDDSVTLQMELDKFNQRIEEARSADQQSIRRTKGLLDRALEEMVESREMQGFQTPSGRCWHVTPECPTLANSDPRGSMSELPAVFVSALM